MLGELIKGLLARLFPQEDRLVQIAEELLSVNEAALEKHGIVLSGFDMRRVDHWQQGLNALGYKVEGKIIAEDGQYGSQLAQALVQLQFKHGDHRLAGSGLPNGMTIKLLAEDLKAAGQKVYCPF